MKLLDLFCGAGGAGMGYSRAGFEVVGVDLHAQKRYPFEFHQGDALEYLAAHAHEYDAIHASPPCQAHTSLRALQKGKVYQDLIPATRAALIASCKPYVIENVPGAPMGESGWLLLLCGTMFGLVTPDGRAEIRRHRLFECSFCFGLRPACQHGGATLCVVGNQPEDRSGPRQDNGRRLTLSAVGDHPHSAAVRHRERREALTVTGHSTHGARYTKSRKVICVAGGKAMAGGMYEQQGTLKRRAMSVTGNKPQTNTVRNVERETFTVDDARAAMGIDWMPMKSLSQAIPPAYTQWLGLRMLEAIRSAERVA